MLKQRRNRRVFAVSASVVALAGLGGLGGLGGFDGWRAGAQVSGQQVPPVESTTTTAPPASTTTTSPRSSTTTAPPPDEGGSAPDHDGGGEAGGAAPGPRVVPTEAQARINAYPRSKANNTKRLLAALQPLVDQGFTPVQAAVVGFGRFPVGGDANFVNDWLYPRFTPDFRFHEGTDIFAVTGTPVRSPTEGTLTRVTGRLGGQAVYVHQDDGTYFYLAHLSAWNEAIPHGARVKVGDVVGFVGDSGDAKGGSPHTHFEIHPAPVKEVVTGKGKSRTVTYKVTPVPKGTRLPPVDPKPYLDQWLNEAVERAPKVVAAYAQSRPRNGLRSVLPPSPVAASASVFAGPSGPPQSQLLWASSANPTGGALAVAEAEAGRLAASIDWEARTRQEAARRQAWEQAEARARAALMPLTPLALQLFV